jgi:hypothetical protein
MSPLGFAPVRTFAFQHSRKRIKQDGSSQIDYERGNTSGEKPYGLRSEVCPIEFASLRDQIAARRHLWLDLDL